MPLVRGLGPLGRGHGGAAASTLLDSLVAYWKLDEASGTRNDSVGTNHLTANNNPLSAAGKVGDAASLVAASSQSLSIASNSTVQMGDIDFVIAGWLRASSALDQARGVVSKWNGAGASEYLIRTEAGGGLTFYITANGSSFVSVGRSGLVINTFHCFIAWHDSVANTINLQVDNGTVGSTSHSTGVFVGTTPLYLGLQLNGPLYHNGLLDEVAICKGRIWTPAERTAFYNAGNGITYPFS